MSCDMFEPSEFPSLDSCRKRFLCTYKGVDLAPHPVVRYIPQAPSPHPSPDFNSDALVDMCKVAVFVWHGCSIKSLYGMVVLSSLCMAWFFHQVFVWHGCSIKSLYGMAVLSSLCMAWLFYQYLIQQTCFISASPELERNKFVHFRYHLSEQIVVLYSQRAVHPRANDKL